MNFQFDKLYKLKLSIRLTNIYIYSIVIRYTYIYIKFEHANKCLKYQRLYKINYNNLC